MEEIKSESLYMQVPYLTADKNDSITSHYSTQMMVLHQGLIWNCVVKATKLPLHILHVWDGWDISFHRSFTVCCSYFTKTYFDFARNVRKSFQVWKFLQTTSWTATPTDVSHQRPIDSNSVLCYLCTGCSSEVSEAMLTW